MAAVGRHDLATPDDKRKLEELISGTAGAADCAGAKLNADMVGQSAAWIAEQAGFPVPADTSIILFEVSGVGPAVPQHRGTAGGAHVGHPVGALAEHRHQIPLALIGGDHERAADRAAGAAGRSPRV